MAMNTPLDTAEATPRQSVPRKMLFRWLFVYLVIYIFPFPLDLVTSIDEPYARLRVELVNKATGQTYDVRNIATGSSDTTFHYWQMLSIAALATGVAGMWSLLARQGNTSARLARWLRVYVRFYVAANMIAYGAAKVIPVQFQSPTLDRLLQPFGESSPMGLLWTFMGAAPAYVIFTGVCEMAGGLLLTARRTTLLGALICIGVLSNVVMLNLSYDVCVKLDSLHLLGMAVFLAVPDLGRLGRMFLLNRPVESADLSPLFSRPRLERAALAMRTLLVVAFTGWNLSLIWAFYQTSAAHAERTPFYGVWDVAKFELDGHEYLPLITDEDRWRRVVFDADRKTFSVWMAIQPMTGIMARYRARIDLEDRRIHLSQRADRAWEAAFSFRQPESTLLDLEGDLDGQRIRARLRKSDAAEFLLMNRGFHWVNELPYLR